MNLIKYVWTLRFPRSLQIAQGAYFLKSAYDEATQLFQCVLLISKIKIANVQ